MSGTFRKRHLTKFRWTFKLKLEVERSLLGNIGIAQRVINMFYNIHEKITMFDLLVNFLLQVNCKNDDFLEFVEKYEIN